jgi:hypothetical protein
VVRHVKAIEGTDSCEFPHLAYVVSGPHAHRARRRHRGEVTGGDTRFTVRIGRSLGAQWAQFSGAMDARPPPRPFAASGPARAAQRRLAPALRTASRT